MSQAIILRTLGPRQPFKSTVPVHASPFVGADLTTAPHTSAYGALVRLVRLNGMRRSDMAPLLGIHTQRAQDLGAVMTFSEARHTQLATALRLPDVPSSWNLSAWFPFAAPSSLMKEGWRFRYCPDCFRSGYHVHLHQLPWFDRCPWHGTALTTTCRACRKDIRTGADWLEDRDMICECGHSFIDTSATIKGALAPPAGAKTFLDDYLAWAAQERGCAMLAAPPNYSEPAVPLATIVILPGRWQPWAATGSSFHTRMWSNSGHPAPGALQALSDLETLRHDRPGFLRLSPNHAKACAQVAAQLALKLPKETLSDGEMSLFLAGAGIEAPLLFEPARRPLSGEVSSMVLWQTSAGNFLNLTCLHPAAYRPVTTILDTVMGTRTLVDFHAQTCAGELDLLLRCCRDVLARGYAEGLRSVLAPYFPSLWKMERDRPHLTQPWLIVRRRGGAISSIRAVWEPLNLSGRQAAEAIQEADDANRRRERYSGRSGRKK